MTPFQRGWGISSLSGWQRSPSPSPRLPRNYGRHIFSAGEGDGERCQPDSEEIPGLAKRGSRLMRFTVRQASPLIYDVEHYFRRKFRTRRVHIQMLKPRFFLPNRLKTQTDISTTRSLFMVSDLMTNISYSFPSLNYSNNNCTSMGMIDHNTLPSVTYGIFPLRVDAC